MKKAVLFSLVLMMIAPLSMAEQLATVVRSAKLHASPSYEGKFQGQLKAGEQVSIQQRKGGWYRVVTEGSQQGWLRMISVKFNNVNRVKATDNRGFSWTNRGSSVATGVRGLGKENKGPAVKQRGSRIEQTDQYTVTKNEAKDFAKKGRLQSKPVKYIEPKRD